MEIDLPHPPSLRVVGQFEGPVAIRKGLPIAYRQARRRARRSMLKKLAIIGFITLALGALTSTSHAFGGVTGTGLPSEEATSSVWASGELYVVQPGDTINSIALKFNSVHPAIAKRAIEGEIKSTVVLPGEHILVP